MLRCTLAASKSNFPFSAYSSSSSSSSSSPSLCSFAYTHTHTHPRSTNQLPRDRVGIIRTPCKYNPKRNKKKPTNKNGCAIFFCNNKSKTNILDADSNTMSDHRVFFGFFCFSFPFFFKSLSTFYLSMMARLAIHHL